MEKKEYVEETFMKTVKRCSKTSIYCDKCGKRLATDLPLVSDFTNKKYKNVIIYSITYTTDHDFDKRRIEDFCENCAKEKAKDLIDECKSYHGGMDDYSFNVEPIIVRDFGEDVEF